MEGWRKFGIGAMFLSLGGGLAVLSILRETPTARVDWLGMGAYMIGLFPVVGAVIYGNIKVHQAQAMGGNSVVAS